MEKLMFKYGKRFPRIKKKTLMMENYIDLSTLPAPPDSSANLQRVYTNTKISDPKILFPIDGNDKKGNCVMCGTAHLFTVYQGFIGKVFIPAAADVIKAYLKRTCGRDKGLVMLDFLTWLRKHSVFGEEILGFGKIRNTHNHLMVKQCIYIFGGLLTGINVQQDAQQDFFDRKIWTPGPLLNEGHCIDTADYTPDILNNLTWGNDQGGTWPWWDLTVDESYVIIPKEVEDPNFAPGMDKDKFLADLAIVTN
jgi:hypothetical protein